MAKKKHSNLHNNQNIHHLYIIYDYKDRAIFKFGISDKPVNTSKSSSRLDSQITLFNRVNGTERFRGRIISYPIYGRLKARELEDERIREFIDKYQRFPRGNENHVFLKNH